LLSKTVQLLFLRRAWGAAVRQVSLRWLLSRLLRSSLWVVLQSGRALSPWSLRGALAVPPAPPRQLALLSLVGAARRPGVRCRVLSLVVSAVAIAGGGFVATRWASCFVAFFGLFGLFSLALCRILRYNGVKLLARGFLVSPSSLCSVRSVAFSAFRSGGLVSVALRPARWSASVLVLVAGFRSPVGAGVFARRWAARLGRSVVVRQSGRFWSVSVPVAGVPSGSWSGLWVRGGLRGLLRALRLLASASPARLVAAGGVCRG
jgi:hypothetical protein